MPPVREGQQGVLLRTPHGDVFQTLPLPGGKTPAVWAKEVAQRAGVSEARWTLATAQRLSGSFTPTQRWRRVATARGR